jgi:hypothetical protein
MNRLSNIDASIQQVTRNEHDCLNWDAHLIAGINGLAEINWLI